MAFDYVYELSYVRCHVFLLWHVSFDIFFEMFLDFEIEMLIRNRHEPVLPGGDEIAAAVRPLDARGGIVRAVMVVLGTLAGVDVFLR